MDTNNLKELIKQAQEGDDVARKTIHDEFKEVVDEIVTRYHSATFKEGVPSIPEKAEELIDDAIDRGDEVDLHALDLKLSRYASQSVVPKRIIYHRNI